MYFSIMIGSGIFFIMMSFTLFLPMIIVAPQKFAICFTLGCMFIMGAFFALKGPKSQALHMISKEVRLLLLISDMLLKHSSDLEMTLDWLSSCYWHLTMSIVHQWRCCHFWKLPSSLSNFVTSFLSCVSRSVESCQDLEIGMWRCALNLPPYQLLCKLDICKLGLLIAAVFLSLY